MGKSINVAKRGAVYVLLSVECRVCGASPIF